eukprot:jgi/Psemu1/290540/fgenesh1_pg.512_\
MNQSSNGGDGTARPLADDAARSAFVTVPTTSPSHQPPTATTAGITASHLAAMAAGSNAYSPMDHGAAFMMSNAAATIAAVAASAVQQMTQAKANPATTGAPAQGGPPTALSSSLYHAALQGNRNQLISGTTTAPTVPPVTHAALLTALANASQTSAPPSVPSHTDAAAAAASSLLRPNAPVLSQPTTTLASPALLSDMQSWSLEQLDTHIGLLQQMNQSVPHSVAILRAEAERKIKKKNDKRVANRKSASNSRARKKALVEEMTKTNARLKKQAMILALLPDLVMTTTTDGEITFCSAQAERILRYKTGDLVGAKLYNLLVPSSRHALKNLIEELVHPGKAKAARASAAAQARRGAKRTISNQNKSGDRNDASKNTEETANGNSNGSARDSSRNGGNSTDDTSGAAVVSEQSFPLSVVEVESKQQAQQQNQRAEGGSNENLDSITSNSGGSGEDDGGTSSERQKKESTTTRGRADDYSSLSSETKNRRANRNLDRNVRSHNQRMLEESRKNNNGPKDDVTGASVTANNASARLSSLEHCPDASRATKREEPPPYESAEDQSSSDDSLLAGVEEKKKSEDVSDDSGYRESNDSREESSSSWSDTSRSNDHRKKPLAPTCRMCLIRVDLTTVWCEVTSSIRNKSADDDAGDVKATNSKSTESSETSGPKLDQEILLCLRPIRNSSKKVDESCRFVPSTKYASSAALKDVSDPWVSTSSGGETNEAKSNSDRNITNNNAKQQELNKKRPPKKRLMATGVDAYTNNNPDQKRAKTESTNQQGPNASETEKSVVESLMLMNKSSQ